MDQYIAADGDLLLGDSSDLPLLSLPLLPIVRQCFGSGVGRDSLCRGAVSGVLVVPLDLSREGPFDVDQTASRSGPLPGCWRAYRDIDCLKSL